MVRNGSPWSIVSRELRFLSAATLVNLGAGPPATVQPSDVCNTDQEFDRNLMRDPRTAPPSLVALGFSTLRNSVKTLSVYCFTLLNFETIWYAG